MTNRRSFLLALPALALAGCHRFSFEQGLMGSCRNSSGAGRLAAVQAAWKGLRPDQVWDVHTHLFGNGRTRTGIWVEPDMDHPRTIEGRVRHAFFVNGGCVGEDEDRMDTGMVDRLVHVIGELPAGAKSMLLAFDFTHDESGRKREDLTTFSVSDAYAARVAGRHPDRFEWIASIHPYRADAVEALEKARAAGARAVKWLPPAMGIDIASPRCHAFYDAMRRVNLPLLTHIGEEQAVPGARRHDLANPLALRVPLERGVRVIAAHCATLGASPDTDAVKNADKAPQAENFTLFSRLMADKRYHGLLFGDISAVTQLNRSPYLPRLLAMGDWDGRLLNGSDYPLPGIMPLFSLDRLVSIGVLDPKVVPALRELRDVNALLFDFVLKRNLRSGGRGFPASAFETRGFFVEPGRG